MGITAAQLDQLYHNLGRKTPTEQLKDKASKLKNVAKVVNGIAFQSSLESQAYRILKLWETAGAISELRMQPAFTLQESFRDGSGKTIKSIRYSADFRFFDNETRRVRYVDAKGFITQAFSRTMKLMANKFPDVDIELWDKAKIKELSRR